MPQMDDWTIFLPPQLNKDDIGIKNSRKIEAGVS